MNYPDLEAEFDDDGEFTTELSGNDNIPEGNEVTFTLIPLDGEESMVDLAHKKTEEPASTSNILAYAGATIVLLLAAR